MANNSDLRQRGLLLFGLVAVIAAVVLLVLVRWPSQSPAQAPPDVAPSEPGWEIRYQATTALARRGSELVPFDVLAEMLDEQKQLRNCVTKTKDGKEVSNEGAARTNVISGLKAFVEWQKSPAAAKVSAEKKAEVQKVYDAIEKLRETPNTQLRAEVERAREALGVKG